jgi:formylglycine-generating enzyme required for sulfatase activity
MVVSEPLLPKEQDHLSSVKPEPEVVPKQDDVPSVQNKHTVKYEPIEIQEEEHLDIGSMKKTFRILMIMSLLIGLYVLVQYVLLRERPSFISPEPDIEIEEILKQELAENHPIEMLLVPADTLIMGSIGPDAEADEFPLLTVPLKSFMISATEISQKQWKMVFENNPSLFKGDDLPVENVSFYDAIEFCNAKSLKDGLSPAYDYLGAEIVCDFEANGYRLPTEAEWEFAAKGGDGMDFSLYSGSNIAPEVAWYAQNSGAESHKVGSKKANALGLYDMSGNVFEWVWNWYAPYSHRISNHYLGPETGTDKVIRGGSWYHNDTLLRNTARLYAKPFSKTSYIGFRVVRSK